MTVPVLITFTLIVLVAVTGVVLQLRLVTRTGGLRPSWETPTEPEAEPAPEHEPYRAPRALPRKTSTPRGIPPPATPQLRPMYVSEYCSQGDACALCPGDGCECTCMHRPEIIVARNKAEYDRAHQEVPA